MKKGKKLYEGKAKIIYSTSDKNLVIQYFKDDARDKMEVLGTMNEQILNVLLWGVKK